eukprot:CAMPEP_0119108012 /NCGR_PEP_ID=MMETSP1180-20130426/12991_1 /TAXON_ID=3052 ORGANISM="Chlamydomonas cf sp, Strain CCMP681" /NCGR_SAMPLE_ID=MMETSP1180 /ASSEMBLY_ACC=CAM_ASM_000741 /LENGTH=385 /DNA_ID=CAMNT_0007093571 /DNA_START=92 /DNA_END=1249 /DNA_ORIENTATION=-
MRIHSRATAHLHPCASARIQQCVVGVSSQRTNQAAQLRSKTQAEMMSFLGSRGKQTAVDALPASVEAVQSVETTELSQRFTGPDLPTPPSKTLAWACAVSYLPHPDKVHYGGEDAYFVSDVGGGAMGVADGVGGWAESGVNPADYSRLLMKIACAYLEGKDQFANDGVDRHESPLIDPRGALNAAHENTKVPGSATACVMQLDPVTNTLEAANLGDSGFVVIRNGAVVAKSRPLQHYFDCPLQFGAYPEFVEATDTADMADTYSIPLASGDVIVAGSDGLWDNLYQTEITALVPRNANELQRSADSISTAARRHAGDSEFASPYTREALAQGLDLPWWEKLAGMHIKRTGLHLKQLTGGKMDDITVMVALVMEKDALETSSTPTA